MTVPAQKLLVLFVHAKDEVAKKKLAEASVTGVLNNRRLDVLAVEGRSEGDFGVVLKSPLDEFGVQDVLKREKLITAAQLGHYEIPVRGTTSITERAVPAAMKIAAE